MPQQLNFKEIAESVDIEQVVAHLCINLKRGKDIRGACPACNGDDRTLQIFPDTNSFRCHKAGLSGDCISLYSHVMGYQGQYKAAKEVAELFGIANASRTQTVPPTAPQAPRAEPTAPPSKKYEFDPAKFAAKLTYSPEVSALGINQADAERLLVGFHPQRKKVYFALRNPDGSVSGFVAFNGELTLPPQWLLPDPKVIHLRRA